MSGIIKHKPKIVNLDLVSESLRLSLIKTSKGIEIISDLKKALKFFNSSLWLEMKNTNDGHDFAYQYMKALFPNIKVMFTSNGVPTHDDDDLFNSLTKSQLKFVKKVDSGKINRKLNGNISSFTNCEPTDTSDEDDSCVTFNECNETNLFYKDGICGITIGSGAYFEIDFTSVTGLQIQTGSISVAFS